MIFVDKLRPCLKNKNWRYDKSCHLFATDVKELKIFAVKIGLKESWFQDNKRLPHFDLTREMRTRAICNGAIEVSNRDFYEILKKPRRSEPGKKNSNEST